MTGNRLVALALLGVVLLSGVVIFNPSPSPASAASTSNVHSLSLSALPPNLPTSSSGTSNFQALVVSIVDQSGNPVISPNDTTVYLASSKSAVLTVQPTVVIPAGAQYAIASVYTTATPGSSTVTAVSPGLGSASTNFQTYMARGYPTQLRVFALPASFPSGPASSGTFAVAVVDAAGFPARTVQATHVSVTTSEVSIMSVTDVSIPLNGTIGYGTMSITGSPGSAAMTASASGLTSSSAVVSVVISPSAPVALLLTPPPISLPANGGTYSVLTVSLVGVNGTPAISNSPVEVLLSSSRTDIATIPDVVDIPSGQSFAEIPVTTFSAPGQTFITASAVNFLSSSAQISTVEIPPTKLGIYLADSSAVVSTKANVLNLVVQLQDSQGIPAEARTAANVIISFSDNSLLQSPIMVTIPKGYDLVYTSISLTKGATGAFTAISNGLSAASASFDANGLTVTHTFAAASYSIAAGQSTPIVFTLKAQGSPVEGASLSWSATQGTVTASSSTTDANGRWSGIFTSSAQGSSRITISAVDPIFGTTNSSLYITIGSAQSNAHPTLLSQLLTFPYILILIAIPVVVVVVVAVVVVRRRRKSAEADEALSQEETGFNYYGGRPGVLQGGL